MLERKNDMRGDVEFACLDSLVPKNHLLRKIDRVVDLTQIYGMVEHLYRDFEHIFAWILEAAIEKGFVKAETIFIDEQTGIFPQLRIYL